MEGQPPCRSPDSPETTLPLHLAEPATASTRSSSTSELWLQPPRSVKASKMRRVKATVTIAAIGTSGGAITFTYTLTSDVDASPIPTPASGSPPTPAETQPSPPAAPTPAARPPSTSTPAPSTSGARKPAGTSPTPTRKPYPNHVIATSGARKQSPMTRSAGTLLMGAHQNRKAGGKP